MAGFIFSMQSVLRLKKQHITQIRHELALRMEDLRNEELELATMILERNCILEQFSRTRLDVMSLQTHYAYRNQIQERIQEGHKALVVCNRHIEEVRARLLEMTKEKEILLKLREREYEAYLSEQLSEEQKALDETVSYMYNMKNRALALGGDRN